MLYKNEEYLTAWEVSQRFGINKATPRQWYCRGTVDSYRVYRNGIPVNERCFDEDPPSKGNRYRRMFKLSDVEVKVNGMRSRVDNGEY